MNNTNTPIRLFIDMDGTIARFYERADCLERMFEPGFFIGLKEYKNVIHGLNLVKTLMPQKIEFYILSAINPNIMEQCAKEKQGWVNKYFPAADRCFFTKFGENKAEAIKEFIGGKVQKTDFLIDDYNANLLEWEKAGGSSIKMVNEINDRGTIGPLWSGYRIRHDFAPERICQDIMAFFKSLQ